MKLFSYLLFFAVFALAGCVASTPPRPNDTAMFVTEHAGFLLQDGSVKYGMTYRLKQSREHPFVVEVAFENPEPGSSYLTTSKSIEPGTTEIMLHSPKLPGIKNNQIYSTQLKAYSDPSRTNLLGEHTQDVLFNLPQEILLKTGVKVYE